MTPTLLQVAALTVELATGHPCPAPAEPRPLLTLGVGCPAPWAGTLYTPEEHRRMRTGCAQAVAEADARGEALAVAREGLTVCDAARAEVERREAAGLGEARGIIAALEARLAEAPPAPALWPWAALTGGLALGGAGVGWVAGRPPGEVAAYGVAGAGLGVAVALMVERWAR